MKLQCKNKNKFVDSKRANQLIKLKDIRYRSELRLKL